MKAILFRTLVFTHRYVGIAIGWLMLLWCLSGLVMLYVSYPELKEAERYTALNTVDVAQCCNVPQSLFPADMPIATVAVEMLVDRPVLRVHLDFGPSAFIDLRTGNAIGSIAQDTVLAAAHQHLPAGNTATPQILGLISRDQWTVYSRYNNDRPLHHLALRDAAGTQVYVSSVDGRVVQKTTRMQRFWNWLGAVPHWLYFTAIRENVALWNNLVIYSALLGGFLTVFGLLLGVWQLRRKFDNQLHSPYRGWKYWHHVPGLVFGVLVLTWVVSGLLSMKPWGLLKSEGYGPEAWHLRGELPTWQGVQASLQRLSSANLPANAVHVESSIVQGQLHYLVSTRAGARIRYDAHWQIAPMTESLQQHLAQQLGGKAELLHSEDAYWYSNVHAPVALPVIRVIAADNTRYYLDSVSGELLSKFDAGARGYRWLHLGLHRMDFAAVLRTRPLRDVLMWVLLLGASTVCLTGVWMGVTRLRRR